jgi:hypothetical protein
MPICRAVLGRLVVLVVALLAVAPEDGRMAAQAPAQDGRRGPVLLVREGDEASTPLAVDSARYEVTILGHVATTRATLQFYNESDRTYEGELVFPLPAGSVVSGFALDVDGTMVDAVLVEAREARVAFEAEVRKGIDPGLVEWVRGDVFRTRVWPVPPRGRRTIRVEYVSELPVRVQGAGVEARYELPLRFGSTLSELALRVEIAGGDATPAIESAPTGFAFGPWQERLVAEATQRDVVPQDLVIALPRASRALVTAETDANGERYFVIDDLPAVPGPVAAHDPVRRIAVLWDASLSRDTADRERDLRLLGAHLARLGNVEVVAAVFRDVAEAPRRFTVTGGDARTVVDALRAAPCDGATTLSALRVPDDVAYALVFTDGVWTLGGSPALGRSTPLYVLHGSADADRGLLSAWAAARGGAAIDLRGRSDVDVLDRIGQPVYSLLAVEADGGIADVEPAVAQPVDGRVTVAGRLTAAAARVRLRYGFPGGGGEQVTTFEVRANSAPSTGMAGRRWAGRRVAALSLVDPRAGAILELGRRFSIVTPRTSLLVLEMLDQYVLHGIRPPDTLPDLQRQYDEHVRENAEERGDTLADVVEMWTAHVAWWKRRFEYAPGFRYKGSGEVVHGVAGGVAGGVPGMSGALPGRVATVAAAPVEAPPAVPPPPAPPPPPVGSLTEQVEVRATIPTLDTSSSMTEYLSVDTRARALGSTITVAEWDPDSPYLEAIRSAAATKAYDTYLSQRARFGTSPAFFLDCADVFARRRDRRLALRILSNLAELRFEDARLLRVLAHRLEQLDDLDRAVEIFERVRHMRPEEPQSHRDLALVLDRRASRHLLAARPVPAAAAADARRALSLLAEVVMGTWDDRFEGIERLALEEANRLASLLERRQIPAAWPLDPRLRQLLDVDVRVVLTWDTDLTDMDLWVTEPSDERCDYNHTLTTIGGTISNDFTDGYGPEVYAIRRAMAGRYRIQANFYGSRAQALTGPATVQATVVTDYGRPGERRRVMTLRLTAEKAEVDIGTIAVTPAAKP